VSREKRDKRRNEIGGVEKGGCKTKKKKGRAEKNRESRYRGVAQSASKGGTKPTM